MICLCSMCIFGSMIYLLGQVNIVEHEQKYCSVRTVWVGAWAACANLFMKIRELTWEFLNYCTIWCPY